MELKRIKTGDRLTTTNRPTRDVIVLYGDALILRKASLRGERTHEIAKTNHAFNGMFEVCGVLCLCPSSDDNLPEDDLRASWVEFIELGKIDLVVREAQRYGDVALFNQRNLAPKD